MPYFLDLKNYNGKFLYNPEIIVKKEEPQEEPPVQQMKQMNITEPQETIEPIDEILGGSIIGKKKKYINNIELFFLTIRI